MRRKTTWLLAAVTAVVTLNLAWEHQSILIPMVRTDEYYQLSVREPFIYRILPALLYNALFPSSGMNTGLNAPFDSSFNIFQVFLDAVSLACTYFLMSRITERLNPDLHPSLRLSFAAAGGLMVVVFGYFMVPNRALFYPYDFPDLCLASLIFFLCIRLEGRAEYLLPVAVLVASLNKETAVFYSSLYLALRMDLPGARIRTVAVMSLCCLSSVAARVAAISIVRHFDLGSRTVGQQYEFHLMYTLQQTTNPLFIFAMLNVCSYLYVAVYLLRRRLDRTDAWILLMVGGWAAIMSVVGVIRELRIFAPISLLLFIVIARHLREIVGNWVEAARPLGDRLPR